MLELVSRAARYAHESPELTVAVPTATFGNVGTDRRGDTTDLRGEPESLDSRKARGPRI